MPEQTVEVSVVIPCYNEGNLLEANVAKVEAVLSADDRSYELIFVDDKSIDQTREVISTICHNRHNCRTVFNQSNMGRGATFMIGAELAQGKYVGYLDIDLEVSEQFLPAVLKELDMGADVATVYRDYQLKWYPIFLIRALLSRGYKRLVRWYLKLPLKDTETGFKFFRTAAYIRIADECQNQHWFWDTEVMTIAHYKGLDIVEVPGEFIKKKEKVSTVRIIPDTIMYFKELRKFRKRLRSMF